MTERAAHLIDEVLPRVPVRQWVLTVPYRLRCRMAFEDPREIREILGALALSAEPVDRAPPSRKPFDVNPTPDVCA